MSTPAEVLRSLSQQASEIATSPVGRVGDLADVVAALGDVLADVLDDAVVGRLEIGAELSLTLRVKATVVGVSDSHGLSYELQLETRDYLAGRTVCVDADEVVAAADV